MRVLLALTRALSGHIGAVGFCWGARYALILAQDSSPAKVDCTIGFHPCECRSKGHIPESTLRYDLLSIDLLSIKADKTYVAAFLVTADVQDIKSTPVAILKGTKDAMMSDDDLEEVCCWPTSHLVVHFPFFVILSGNSEQTAARGQFARCDVAQICGH